MTEQIKVGDVVWLKSGSPAMSVIRINTPHEEQGFGADVEKWAMCVWFDASGERGHGRYPLESLTKVPPNKEAPEEEKPKEGIGF